MPKNMMRNCRLQSSLHGLWVTEGPEAPGQAAAQQVGEQGSLDSRSLLMLTPSHGRVFPVSCTCTAGSWFSDQMRFSLCCDQAALTMTACQLP